MKPRIFISSTFYDLKHIREELANFVRSYGYEPVVFEDGDIGYTPGKTLDSSCYESMKNSDMVILIIGGEYGSPASGEKKDDFKEYISVTRNEFRTAINSGIPVFAMIDKSVMAEYRMYEANYDLIEKEKKELNFVSTKNVNVLRFIKEVKGLVTLPVQEFEKPSEIKGFISKQWADMFKNYLSFLRNKEENRKIESSVNEMKALIEKMDIMLDSVGKNVLSQNDSEDYEEVIIQQDILSVCNLILSSFRFHLLDDNAIDKNSHKKLVKKFISLLKKSHQENLWENLSFLKLENSSLFFEYFSAKEFDNFFISDDYIKRVGNKYKLLYDEKNEKHIVDLITDNFDALFL